MHRLSLSRLLHLMTFVPLVALAVFGATIIVGSLHAYRDIEAVNTLEDLVTTASSLTVFALNHESTATHPFVASGSETARAAMMAKRLASDDAIRAFKRAAAASKLSDPQALECISDIERRLEGLADFRAKADDRTLQRQESGTLLQPIAARLADLILRVAMVTNNVRIKNRLLALYAILQLNDGERIENGRAENALAAGFLDAQLYQLLLVGLSKQATFSKEFANFGSAAAQERLRAFSAGPHGQAIEAMRPAILAFNQGSRIRDQDAGRLRDALTARNTLTAEVVELTLTELKDETHALRDETLWETIIYTSATVLIFIVVIAISRLVGKAVRRLLGELTQVMQKIANGQLTVAVTNRDRADEIGAMAQTVEVFKQNAIAIHSMERERSEQKDRTAAEKQNTLNQLADAFEAEILRVINTVSTAASQLQQNANIMNSTAAETDRQSKLVQGASEQAIGNVRTVADAAEELSKSIDEIGQQVSAATKVTTSAVSQVATTTSMVEKLVAVVHRIGEIINLINAIASQTNLLALNATIEAARAGEAGRGFAVVASEVKNLASQTAKATDEIASHIGAVQSGTNDVVNAIQAISGTIDEINNISATIAAAVTEQNATTAEIARNAEQAAGGSREVSGNIRSVSRAAADTGRVATDMVKAAVDLTQQAAALRVGADAFIARVRAA
jgi:methyl-accepting chemotaxis protein